MSPCYPFRPIPGQCGPHRRGPLPAPPFDPQDYWATRKLVSSLFGSLETTKLDKVDVVDPSAKAEAGKAADAKSTYEELNRISGMASDAKEIAESKADKATTLAGYGITDAATKVELASKADLVDGKVPAAQLPSFVDDVLEHDTVSDFPVTGESGKIYIDKETNKTYRWSGTQYIEISQSLALGETESTAYPGDKGKVASETAFAAYNVANNVASAIVDHTENKSNPHAVTAAQVGAVPLVEDEKGNKTAVTIGSRVSDVPVGEGSLANGDTVIAYGRGSHAEGMNTVASGNYSHTDGVNTFAEADYSYAGGVHAGTKIGDEYAYAWNGDGLVSQYTSNGPGTFNINPARGLDGFFIGEQTIAEAINVAIAGKADESELKDSVDALSREMDGKLSKSDVVAPSGDSRDGQAADAKVVRAELDSIINMASEAARDAGTALYDIGETKAALDNIKITAEDALWATERLENNKVQTLKLEDDSVKTSAENGVAKLDDFFTESNSLLNSRITYERNATGLKDRAFNALTFDGTEFNLSTALEAVTPTASGQPRDLLIVATATAATTISFTAGTIKGDKPTIDGSGTWLITLTEYASGVWYCRQIKMEDAA